MRWPGAAAICRPRRAGGLRRNQTRRHLLSDFRPQPGEKMRGCGSRHPVGCLPRWPVRTGAGAELSSSGLPPRRARWFSDLLLEQLPEHSHAQLQHLLVVQGPDGRHGLPGDHRHQHAVLLLQTGEEGPGSSRSLLSGRKSPAPVLTSTPDPAAPPHPRLGPQPTSLTKLLIHLDILWQEGG